MAKIKLVSVSGIIPAGFHIFKIEEAKYDEDFGKMEVDMVTAKGQKYKEKFQLLGQNGVNEGAMKAFSYFAKTALDDFSIDEIDPEMLVGRYIEMEIVHEEVPSRKDPNETLTFANSKSKKPAKGFAPDKSIDDILA